MTKYGTDPEVFISTEVIPSSYDENFIKDIPFCDIPISLEREGKIKPMDEDVRHPLYFEGKDYKVIGDGVALEVNLKRPHTDPNEMREIVLDALATVELEAGLKCEVIPVVNFDYQRFCTQENMMDERFATSVIFGCDPDEDAFDVYDCNTIDATSHPYRYGGGHIHLSDIGEAVEYPRVITKLLALTAGNFCNANTKFPELTKVRGELYGNPGRFRRQSYGNGTKGVEYRSPSNEWLTFEKSTFELLFKWIDTAVILFNSPDGKSVLEKFEFPTFSAIKSCNAEKSNVILKQLEKYLQ